MCSVPAVASAGKAVYILVMNGGFQILRLARHSALALGLLLRLAR